MNASLALSPTSPDLCRRLQTPRSSFQFQPSASFHGKRRIRINVRGLQFETFQATLDQFPDTLLGCPMRRFQFYDPINEQYYLDRDPVAFDFILFFYQSNGILSRPETISITAFNEELKFFGITDHSEEEYESESPTATEEEHREDDASPTCLQREGELRRNCWLVMEHPRLNLGGMIWGRISLTVILLSVIAFCIETLPELNCSKQDMDSGSNHTRALDIKRAHRGPNNTLPANPGTCHAARLWFIVETTVVAFFLLEYLVRLYSSPNRWAFVVSILGIVDLSAIAPYFVTLGVYGAGKSKMYQQVTSFSVLRIIRLLRVLRVLKLSRYSYGLKLVGKAFSQTWTILSSLMVCVFMTVVVSSSFLFYAENTDSIPAYFYWAFVTMTTVGYGDVVPTTVLGKLGACGCMFFGIILLFVLPLPVFVTHFSRLYEAKVETRKGRTRKSVVSSPMILDQIIAPPVLKE